MDTQPLALPVDYYELLGLAPAHLLGRRGDDSPRYVPWRAFSPSLPAPHGLGDDPLSPQAVDAAAVRAERAIVSDRALSPGARSLRLAEIELARCILRDPDRRRRYDTLRWPGADGRPLAERLRLLRELQLEAQAELAGPGQGPGAPDGAQLLAEGREAMRRGDFAAARAALRRAADLLPASADAQLAYVRAACAADDPLTFGAFVLQGLADALRRAGAASPGHPAVAPLAHLVAGLLARDAGHRAAARCELEEAVHLQPNLAPAWHGLAAIHLADGQHAAAADAARRAFDADERDEAPLHILAVAAARGGQPALAAAAAGRIAAMRGHPWTAERVLQELGT